MGMKENAKVIVEKKGGVGGGVLVIYKFHSVTTTMKILEF